MMSASNVIKISNPYALLIWYIWFPKKISGQSQIKKEKDRQCSELLCRFCNVDYQNKVMRSAAIFLIWIVCHSSWHRAFDLYYPWQIVQSLQKWKLSPVRKSSFATVCFVFQKIFVRNQCLLIDIAINKLMGLPAITYLSKGGYEGGTFYIYHSNSPHC